MSYMSEQISKQTQQGVFRHRIKCQSLEIVKIFCHLGNKIGAQPGRYRGHHHTRNQECIKQIQKFGTFNHQQRFDL